MPILLMCPDPNCGELFDAPEDMNPGQAAVCPACGGPVPVTGQVDERGRRQVSATPTEPDLPSTRSIRLSDEADTLDLTPAAEETPAESAPRGKGREAGSRMAEKKRPTQRTEGETPSRRMGETPMSLAGETPATQAQEQIVIKDLAGMADHATRVGEGGESIIDRPLAGWVILGLAVLGLLGGATLAWLFSPDHAWLSLYAGAGAGWVLGFSLGFLLVLSAERSESETIRCAACGKNNPQEADTCGLCGAVLPSMNLGPMAMGCLNALRYARGNKGGLVWTGILSMLSSVAVCTWIFLPDMAPGLAKFQWIAGIVAGVVGLMFLAYVLEFVLDAVAQTAAGRDTAPPVPTAGLRLLGVALAGLVLPVLYVLPVVTMPLLPLALAQMSRKLWSVVRIDIALASAARRLKDVVILWLLVLLYFAGAALSVVVALVLHLLTGLVPAVPGSAGIVVQIALTSLVVAVATSLVVLFALAIARCVGLFVRYGE